ncbi:hypothetical protein C8F04DRAFT_40181 [Mycena alexandri]|uniref:DUF6534 domain-containing protein n=1 Tax=Mycena alexandri TaxID=1745969 RepID=A0AAD6WYL0_9AGAR|nr:hypothetical protein C8F04DRAFT_40181 [Mycena alexandri]
MAPIPPPPPGLDIAILAGPVLIGHLLHWGLFGTLSLQIYLYYQAFPNDRASTKGLVYTVYAIELVQTIIMARDSFAIFAHGFGDLGALASVHLEWFAVCVLGGIVGLIGQSFYAYRVYVLSGSWSIPAVILLVSLTSAVGAILTGVFSAAGSNVSNLQSRTNTIVSGLWLGGSGLADIIIATSLTYCLLKGGKGVPQHTHELVVKLVRLIIETGALTAAVAVVNLTLFVSFPGKPYFITCSAVLPTLYANTILVILNARMQIVGGRGYVSGTQVLSPSFLQTGPAGTATLNFAHLSVGTTTRERVEGVEGREARGAVEMKGAANCSTDSRM